MLKGKKVAKLCNQDLDILEKLFFSLECFFFFSKKNTQKKTKAIDTAQKKRTRAFSRSIHKEVL